MPYEVSLCATHPAIQALVAPWICEARLPVDRPLTLHIEVGALSPPATDDRPIFRQGQVAIRSGTVDAPIVLDWGIGLGRGIIESTGTDARVVVNEAGLERPGELLRSFLLNVCILLVRRAGLHHVHGATLRDPSGRGWLLVGVSGSGKSTTAALLARRGWAIGTDDIAFLAAGTDPARTDLLAWRERLALRDDAVTAGGYDGGTAFTARRKTGWFPEELGAEWVSRITPELLVFPVVRPTERTAAAAIRPADAISRLMQCSPWVALEPTLADEHLALMNRLARQARAFELKLGKDLIEQPDRLLELVA